MRRTPILAAIPLTLALAACGGGQDIPVTNDNNVILNDATANYAYTNDGEMTANDAAEMNAANAMDANASMGADNMGMSNSGM